MSNPCHAITQSMAALLLERFKKIDTTVDIYQHLVVGSSVKNYTVLPPLSFELSWSVGAVDSLIHPKPIRVSYLQKHHANKPNEINAAIRDVMMHFSHILYRPLLVIGHPRCGSGYLSQLLGALGLDVGHEKMGKSGISSWMFAVVDISPYALDKYALSRKFSHFQFTIHHVRNPRDAIPSIMRENLHSSESYAFRRKHILQRFGMNLDDATSEIEKAILSYVYWNKIVEESKVDLVVRVEDEEEALKAFLIKKGSNTDFGARPLRRAIENYVEDPLSEELLKGEFQGKDTITVNVKEVAGRKQLIFEGGLGSEQPAVAASSGPASEAAPGPPA